MNGNEVGSGQPLRVAVVAAVLMLPGLSFVSGTDTYAPLLSIPALLLIPGLLFRGGGPPPDGGDGGGGTGPEPPSPPPPFRPRGGLPLPDAEPAKIRLRDHRRPTWRPARSRGGPCHPHPLRPARPIEPRGRAGQMPSPGPGERSQRPEC